MDELDKDYMLDQSMASIAAFKEAARVVNIKKKKNKSTKTPTQKLQYLTEFINDEYDRIMKEYNEIYKKPDEHNTNQE